MSGFHVKLINVYQCLFFIIMCKKKCIVYYNLKANTFYCTNIVEQFEKLHFYMVLESVYIYIVCLHSELDFISEYQ